MYGTFVCVFAQYFSFVCLMFSTILFLLEYVIISIIAVVLAKFLCQLYPFSRKIMPSSMDLISKLYSVMWIRSAK